MAPSISPCLFARTGEDQRIAEILAKGAYPIRSEGRMSDEQSDELRKHLHCLSGVKDGTPTADYGKVEFIEADDGTLRKSAEDIIMESLEEELEKAFSFFSSPSKASTSKHGFKARLPRLIPRFPKISSVAQKMTSLKKKYYRSHQVLSRTPRVPKPVGGGAANPGTSRPRPAKISTSVGKFHMPKAPSAKVPHMGKAPKPVRAKAPSFKMPKPAKMPRAFHRSLAMLDNGAKIEVLHI